MLNRKQMRSVAATSLTCIACLEGISFSFGQFHHSFGNIGVVHLTEPLFFDWG